MRSAFLAEFLALADIRAARRSRAYAVLDEDLSTALFANAGGRERFDLGANGSLPLVLARQLRSGARALAERGTVALSLRLPGGRFAFPAMTRLIRAETASGAGVLLAADPGRAAGASDDPAALLAVLEAAERRLALFDLDGAPVSSASPPDLAADDAVRNGARLLAQSGEAVADLRVGAQILRFYRVADDRVLAIAEAAPRGQAEALPDVAAALGGARPDERAAPSAGETARPKRLRSLWGSAETPKPEAEEPPAAAPAEHAPATPSDQPAIDAPETSQPIDIPSVVTLPEEPPPVPGASLSGPHARVFEPRFEAPPQRFVWQIDAEGRFRSFSPEFAAVVGPHAEGLPGQLFADVAADLGFDADGAIRRLIERRDTWSGRTVLWPVEGTDRRVPIDLAALPVYARDRTFEGFRGFGIVRGAEHEPDPQARGLALAAASRPPEPEPVAPEAAAVAPEAIEAPPAAPAEKPIFRTYEADLPGVSFGRRQAPPPPALVKTRDLARPGVGERRRASELPFLSEAEEAAFREIGAKLGRRRAEAQTPGALRFEPEQASVEPDAEPVLPSPAGADAALEAEASPTPASASAEAPSADIAAVLAALPLAVLVQSAGRLVFANRALLDLAGHADLAALEAAGGLAALFADAAPEPAPGRMAVTRADGTLANARVHLQRIAFENRSSLMMSFEPNENEAPEPAARPEHGELGREVEELRAVLDIATDGVVLADPHGMIRAANGSAEALFGKNGDELAGQPLTGLFAHESQQAVRDYLETMRDPGLAGIMNDGREVIGRVAQGGFVPLFITVGRVPDERGWCVVIRDMSHWKRIEEELLNATRAAEAASLHKSRFLANISHELRTPLNAIIGFADVMASECFGPIGNERYIEYLGDIKRSGHHVLDLVNDLLDISKIEAGKMELSFEAVSLNEVLAEVVATMQPQANRERVIVRSNLPASVPPVVADRRTIRQIALNLLSNSVRFTPAGGQIIASTTYTAGGDVLMRVRDSGVGMTPREIEIALKPFQQVQRPNETPRSGTGLGLPLTKAMAEANRAGFSIRSTPGEGTLVEIAFPAQRVLAD